MATKSDATKMMKINPVLAVEIPEPRRLVMTCEVESMGPGILQDRLNPDILDKNDKKKISKIRGVVLDAAEVKKAAEQMYDRDKRFHDAQYRVPGKRGLYHPGRAFQRAIADAAKLVPGLEKSRARLSAAVTVMDDMVELKGAQPQLDVRVVKRPGSRPGSKVPVLCARALSPSWSATLHILYDPDVISEAQVVALVQRAGFDVGVGNFTPQKGGGPCGMFKFKDARVAEVAK